MVMKHLIPPDPIHQAHIPHQTPPPHHSHWEGIKFTGAACFLEKFDGSQLVGGKYGQDAILQQRLPAEEEEVRILGGGIRRHSWMVAGLIN